MNNYIIRRLLQAAFTVFGVMLLTFVLFKFVAGDPSAQYVNVKLGAEARQAWLHKHKLDLPELVNIKEAGGFKWWKSEFYNSQFYWHLRDNVTFQGQSYSTHQRLIDVIGQKAKYSLGLTVPAMAMGWIFGLGISCLVAYYRGRYVDRAAVFLTVLGMCLPFLAYMIAGQALMFAIAPELAWGLRFKVNIYIPIIISVVAGLGGTVRFYRTIILDEVNRDYVRTARAKGASLPSILYKHVLKNCMLPILTQLVLSIPFLIMGMLLLERFFGIPGMGDLLLASISDRDVPMITALVFLTAVINVIGLLVTDILYGVFDPRIRLQ